MDREEQKRQIQEWKEAREKERREMEEEDKRREREAMEREHARKREEQERTKRHVRNYQESKHLEQEALSLRQELDKEEAKPKVTMEQLRRIQERNEVLTQDRMAAMRRKEQEELRQAQRVAALAEQSSFQRDAERDPTRLTAETMASGLRRESHLRELAAPKQEGYYAIMRPNTLTHRPMRAPASWRAGL